LKAANMSINFSKAEEDVLRHWREIDAFQTQLRLSQDQPRFTFYDGPPFGTPVHKKPLMYQDSQLTLIL
jgi:isoleucyl-tRNA synthetase